MIGKIPIWVDNILIFDNVGNNKKITLVSNFWTSTWMLKKYFDIFFSKKKSIH